MNPAIILGIVTVSVSLLLGGVSVPLVLGKIGMNDFYGVRIKKAFESDELWFRINRYGGLQLLYASCVTALLGLLMIAVPMVPGIILPPPAVPVIYVAAITVPQAVALIRIMRFAKRQ